MGADNTDTFLIPRRSLLQSIGALASVAVTTPLAAAVNDPLAPTPIPAQVPAKEGIAPVAGTHLAYWDTGGNGPAIVLVHPATGTARIWSYQQPVLAKAGYRVIAYSRRGYAGSDPVPKENPGSASSDLHALMEYLRVPKFHLVGSAAGGGVAMDYALSHPERLLSLTLACAVGGVEDKEYVEYAESLRPRGFEQMPAPFRELSPAYRAANPDGAVAWAALERAAITGNRIGQKPVNSITWTRLAGLKVPTLVMGGGADLAMPAPVVRLYASHIPGAEVVVVPDAGHSLYWERPDLFNRALLDFFAKHRG